MTAHDVEVQAQTIKYPRSVFFIIVNEFCERFSYYGMKTVLPLYMSLILGYTEDNASVMYHLFSMLCYFTPVFGAIIADTYLGKFKTILYLSILYAAGNIFLSVAAIPDTLPQETFSLIGLLIIAIGTGGIKPCVSAFGGDQFVRPQQDRQLEQFFSIFYMSINAGSLISTLLTPILRENVKCFDQNTCFPLAFGVPAVLMTTAVVVFVVGKSKYKMNPPEGNVMLDVAKCIGHAAKRKMTTKGEKRKHWLDFASDKFDKQLIEDIKRVLSVLVLFLPIPFFWTLFDQQGSRWTFQATRMDGSLGEHFGIKPDQLQIANPLLILLLVPIFESAIYPLFNKCGLMTPLQRMISGGVLAAVAFIISGIVELKLEPTYAKIPAVGLTRLDFVNTLPCAVKFEYASQTRGDVILNPAGFESLQGVDASKPYDIEAELILGSDGTCGGVNVTNSKWNGQVHGSSQKGYMVIVSVHDGELIFKRMDHEMTLQKSSSGRPRLGFIMNLIGDSSDHVNITLEENSGPGVAHFQAQKTSDSSRIVQTDVKDIDVGTYKLYVHDKGSASLDQSAAEVSVTELKLLPGACYVVVLQPSLNGTGENAVTVQISPANTVHMLWLIPQFFIMTVAEVMFSVTGLQFSFTQAPESMRSVMQAIWLLTVAFGNLFFIIIAKAKAFEKQSHEFFLFAVLMGIDMIILIFLALRYQYVETPNKNKVEEKKTEEKTEPVANGKENMAFDDTAM